MADESLLKHLLSAMGGDTSLVTLPTDRLSVPVFNHNLPVLPAVITYPKSAEQVAEIVKYAGTAGYKIQPKSGGHSYGNYGYGGADGTVVVDLKNFRKFSIDGSTCTATFGAGICLGDLAMLLYRNGRAMAHGTCPQVGIGGHATTGGIGPASRQWGLALDHILEMQVVLADGRIIRTSRTEYEDLFFCLRGAGASFGIVTEFVVCTEPAPMQAVQYEYLSDTVDPAARARMFEAWQHLIADPTLPREFHTAIDVFEQKVIISGTYFGSREEFDALGLDTRFIWLQRAKVTVTSDWMELVDSWANHVLREFGGGAPRAFYAKSLKFTPQTLLPLNVINTVFHFLSTWDRSRGRIFMSFHLGGGAISDVPGDETAFCHRDALYWMQFAVAGPGFVSDTSKGFLDCINAIITCGMTDGTFGAYAGHVDPALPLAQEAYWGANLPRLKKIKSTVDPDDVFHNPQGVPPVCYS